MNWYRFKRRVLAPYIRYMRYRERHRTGFMRAALELHYYRPAFYRFAAATIRNPDIVYEAEIAEGDVVLDAGAHLGEWTARVFEKYRPRIYQFEPDPSSVRRLRQRFAGYPDIRCFDYGLGVRNAELALVRRGMGSTFYGGAGDYGGQAGGVITASVRDAAQVLDELGHDDIALIKLNIEGGEYDVLERLIEVGRIPTVRCFLIQFHEWFDRAHRRRRGIRRALRRTHVLEWDYAFVWEKWVRKPPRRPSAAFPSGWSNRAGPKGYE